MEAIRSSSRRRQLAIHGQPFVNLWSGWQELHLRPHASEARRLLLTYNPILSGAQASPHFHPPRSSTGNRRSAGDRTQAVGL